jgi:hypothetical protein
VNANASKLGSTQSVGAELCETSAAWHLAKVVEVVGADDLVIARWELAAWQVLDFA